MSTTLPPSSTVTTSVTGTVASTFEYESQLPDINPDDPAFQFESQLPDDWNLPAHQPDNSKDKGEANEPLEPVVMHFPSQLLHNDLGNPCFQLDPELLANWNSPVMHQPSIPEFKGEEANKLVEPVVVDIPTLRDSQCTTAMAKDREANTAAAGLANIKRKATEMDYILTSEVKVDDDPNNTICVSGWKGAVKLSITVTKTMPKKIKMEASNLSIQTQAIPTQTCFNNSDLPMDLHKNQKWRREVIPTLILWAGNQESTFNITKQEICNTLQEIIPVVYPILKNTANSILPNSPMVSVLQHVLNLIKSGNVKLKVLADAKVTTRDMHTPVKFNMASGKDSKTVCTFSDQNWGMPMRKFMSAAQRRSTAQLQGIVELALSSLVMGQELDLDALSNAGSDDEYVLIFYLPATYRVFSRN
ncbi:hypothetical protein PISMIDRAFT_8672 [Pisolithus microcarpus 441]|uniref:Uncharacterized protein n=1 Tax=Pisolithus microcarpus 441 TaxID=765257 RepID=A0A0C9ZXH4_9AGAM|nr:hypothetical protein PISMIDRAFT_8672 [Pisolithus microcarpus 441]